MVLTTGQQIIPTPGAATPYVLPRVVPSARPCDEELTPQRLHRLQAAPGEVLRPRRSRSVTFVDGHPTRFYWCLACNRCLRHWRSAFCEQHLTDYKRLRRRQREGTTGAARLDGSLINKLVDGAYDVLQADNHARTATDDERERLELVAGRLRARLLSLIIDELSPRT